MESKKMPIQLKITILSFCVVFFSLLIGGLVVISNVQNIKEEELRKRTMITARTVAQVPEISRYITQYEGWNIINPIAEKIRIINNADYIVVLNKERVRYSHPLQSMIGKVSIGEDEAPAFAEHTYTSLAQGSEGIAVRAFVPVKNESNEQVGVVIVGNIVPTLFDVLTSIKRDIAVIMLFTLLFGVVGSWLLAKHIKQQMLSLEPYEIVRILKERTATFNAMHEGVIAIDNNKSITVFNERAKELLGVKGDVSEKEIQQVVPDIHLLELLTFSKGVYNQEVQIHNTNLLATCVPIEVNSHSIGTVAIFQDRTEVTKIAEELTGVKAFVEALRVQNHEHMNKLHTIAGLIQLGNQEEALGYVFQITEEQGELTNFLSKRFSHDSISGLLLSKVSRGKELHIKLEIDRGSKLEQFPESMDHHDFVIILGNIIENAFTALEKKDMMEKRVFVSVEQDEDICELFIEDNGIGIAEDKISNIFKSGFTTKSEVGHGIGLHLVQQIVEKGEGKIIVDSEVGIGTSFLITIPMKKGMEIVNHE